MKKPEIPVDESARIAALRAYAILDSAPEPEFEALVELAAHIAGVPIAMVSLVDSNRQWFKARVGLVVPETSRDASFCAHVVAERQPLIVRDAHTDARFVDNPLVTGYPGIRFYAGMPMRTADGHFLGTLCTIDRMPRQLEPKQLEMLGLLADQAVAHLEARRINLALAQRTHELAMLHATLDRTQDVILICEPSTDRLAYVNHGAVRQLGYARAELLAMAPWDVVPADHQERYRKAFDDARTAGTVVTFETLYRSRIAHVTQVEVALQYVTAEDGSGRFISVARDISERKRVEQLQSEFVSTVSHELRTPLTSIRGSLGLVAAGITGELPGEAKEYVDIALSNSDRLVRLVNDILDFEKMQAGKLEFRLQSLALPALVQQAHAANMAAATAHGSRLVLATAVPEVEVVVDADRLAQVLSNLVSNATKFSPPDSAIELAVHRVRDCVRVEVRDQGPGIPAEFAERMFQRFAQADTSSTRAKGGTGLGLSISKAIVERMHGTIGFAPIEGGGTCFFVELPALERAEPDGDDTPRVLVCEDSPEVYRGIAAALASGGFRVDIAPTLERGRRLLEAGRYAAVTLDLGLADGDGALLLADVERTGRRLPVILVSGSSRDLGRAGVLVTEVLAKPVRADRLLDAIRRVCASCETREPRVLHVEDDEDVRRIVRRTLPRTWHVIGAASVADAKVLLAAEPFDAVVVDLSLPDGSGAELIPLAGAARVVIFSARDVESALARRVRSALVKTRSTPAELRDVIAALVDEPAEEGAP